MTYKELLEALKEIVRIHDSVLFAGGDDWSDKYRDTYLAEAMADIAREAVAKTG